MDASHVRLEQTLDREGLRALLALEGLFLGVDPHVNPGRVVRFERLAAHIAGVLPFARVD